MKFSRTAIIAIAIVAFLLFFVLPVGLSITAYRKASALDRKLSTTINVIDKRVDANSKALASIVTTSTSQDRRDTGNGIPDSLANQIDLGFVAKGSGHSTEWALTRQLIANPAYWGFKGDPSDAQAVKKWADHTSAVFATEGGYVEWKFGADVRVRGDASFVLKKNADGTIQIDEYVVTAPPSKGNVSINGKSFTLAKTHTLTKSIASSQCFGVSPTTGNKLPVPHWEYVYFPGE